MLRLIGAGLILAGGGALGLCVVSALREQRRTLQQLIRALCSMEAEIQFRQTPLPELLDQLTETLDGPTAVFFKQVRADLFRREEEPFGELWRQNLNLLSMKKEVSSVLEEFGFALGRYDIDASLRTLSYTKQVLQTNLDAVTAGQKQREKLYTTLCFCTAVLVVIVLL